MAGKAAKFLASNVLPKQQRGSMTGISENTIAFGQYGLQALEPAWLTSKQIEAGRRAMIKATRNGGKMWVRIFPYKSFTGKAAGTRMGRGKGAISYWAAVVKPGRILFEIGGVTETVARKAIAVAASKMPIQTRFNKFLG